MVAKEAIMPAPRKYPAELRERAVRLVIEDGEHGVIARAADRRALNCETLRDWVNAERRRTEQPETVDLEAHNARLRGALAEAERDRQISWEKLQSLSVRRPGAQARRVLPN